MRRTKKTKAGVSSEAEPPSKKQKKGKKQKEVKINEGETAVVEEKESAKEKGHSEAVLLNIVAHLEKLDRKFDSLSSKFDLMDARFKKPLVDQKSIDDMVKVAVEERLKVMGIGKNPQNKENLSNVAADQQPEPLSSPQPNTQQKSVCSPLLAETLGKDMGPRNNLSNELDKERGMKKTLAKEFGTHAEDEGANVLDFLYVSPEKATKAEDLRRRSTRNRTIKDEDAEDKKKAVQAETVLKKKEKAAAKRKAAASMKQKQHELKKPKQVELMNEEQAELKNQEQEDSEFAVMTDEVLTEENEILPESPMASQELIRSAIVKEYREKTVKLSPQGFALSEGSSRPVFPYIGDNGTTCMRNNVEPSSAIYDPLAPVDPIVLDKLMQHISRIPPKPPAPAKKRVVRSAAREGDFYSILILERPWPHSQYGWLFDDFKLKPNMMKFTGNGYENLVHGKLPCNFQTNLKWYEHVDHLYGCLPTGGNHWVAFHVYLKKVKVDCYDSIIGEVTAKSASKMLEEFKPITLMLPDILNQNIPANLRTPSRKKFAFRRMSKRYTPQNTQIGDCGVYALKFVECLALGVSFAGINDKNIQGLRLKMAAEILDEGGNRT
ncbi:hypothetical protein YC2023_004308 [Brassica napus]